MTTRELMLLFGKRLAALRVSRHLTQEKLAELVEVSVDSISMLERGLRAPSFSSLCKFSEVFNIQVQELFIFDSHTHQAS